MSTTVTTTVVVKVAEYRRAIRGLDYIFNCLKCAVRPIEKTGGAEAVRQLARQLMAMECKRATQEDRDDADRLIDLTASYLINNNL